MEHLSPELMRMIERQMIVLGGILAIFLGYRLFRLVNLPQESTGKLKTKIMEVTATKIGPGVFFAAFGVFVLWSAMSQQIRMLDSRGNDIQLQTLPAVTEGDLNRLREIVSYLPQSAERAVGTPN